MPIVTVQELVESGVHFGHQTKLWNPKMRPFIYTKRNLIHIIDLKETIRGLLRARHFLFRLAACGAQILYVGTKKQLKELVAAEAQRAGMPVVTERWVGGTLTNYHTIRSRLDRLVLLEQMDADGSMDRLSKKAQSRLRREIRKIRRNLEGIRNLEGLPGAVIVIDPKREDIAVKEAIKMNVPVVAILDTDCDPELIDIPIPGNDDALRSVQALLTKLTDAILEGRRNMDQEAIQFRSEIPQVTGREDRRDRRFGRGGRPAATGRFADRRGGKADSVSFGGRTDEELLASAGAPAKEVAAPSDGSAGEPGAAETPPAAGPAAQPAPEPESGAGSQSAPQESPGAGGEPGAADQAKPDTGAAPAEESGDGDEARA